MSVSSVFVAFRNGLSIIFGKPKAGEGDRKLAKMSQIVMAQIPAYGTSAVRIQVIKGIESDLKRKAQRGGKDAVESLLQNALQTPEYVELLRKLGLQEPHLRVLAMEALRNIDRK